MSLSVEQAEAIQALMAVKKIQATGIEVTES